MRRCLDSHGHILSAHSPPARANAAGPPCCAALLQPFALGRASEAACPASYFLLSSGDACKSAAGAANRTYGGSGIYSHYPYGCYWHTITGSVHYNSNATGVADVYAKPLCAGAHSIRALSW
jgi:hypothetical protein